MMKRDLKFERYYPHPPERVWEALTDRNALAQWYMDNDFEPNVGYQFQFKTEPGPGFNGVLSGEVILADAPHQLVYTFIGGTMKHKTTVTWTLNRQGGGTLLRLEHTGFTGLSDIAISLVLGFGWRRFLKRLPGFLGQLKPYLV